MPTENGEALEINLGTVTGEELLIAGYEALKMVFAASIAQLTTKDALAAKGLYATICNDIDVQRAQFIQAMRDDAAELADNTTTDADGFEYEATLLDDDDGEA